MIELISNLIDKILENKHYQWIFSGIGVAAICGGVALVKKIIKRKKQQHINISTKGDKSPGIVGRDYKVNNDD